MDKILSKEATLYNYRLMEKCRNSYTGMAVFSFIFVIGIIGALWIGWFISFAISFFAVIAIHLFIVKAYHFFLIGGQRGKWCFRWVLYWIGYLPANNYPVRIVRNLQLNILCVGLLWICAMIPWLNESYWISITFLHMWILIPRFWILFRLRRYGTSGFLKINPFNTSLYEQ